MERNSTEREMNVIGGHLMVDVEKVQWKLPQIYEVDYGRCE